MFPTPGNGHQLSANGKLFFVAVRIRGIGCPSLAKRLNRPLFLSFFFGAYGAVVEALFLESAKEIAY